VSVQFSSVTSLCERLYTVYTTKQTRSKLRAHVVHVYFQYICFMFASSSKTPY